jgi:hypothetical protein
MSKGIRPVYVTLLLVAVLAVASGCLHAGGVDAGEVREDAEESLRSVDGYTFETTSVVRADAQGVEGESGSMSVTVEESGEATDGRMMVDSTVGVRGEEISQEVYVGSEGGYLRLTGGPGGASEGGDWLEFAGNETGIPPADNHTRILGLPAERHARLLGDTTAGYEYAGTGEVDGESAYILRARATTEAFRGFVFRRARALTARVGVVSEEFFDEAEVGNVTVRYWVSEETDRVLRVEATGNVSTTVQTHDGGVGETPVDVTVETDTRLSYGEAVEVERPEGIEDAEELGAPSQGSSATATTRVTGGSSSGEGGPAVVDTVEVRVRERGGVENRTATVTTMSAPRPDVDRIVARAVESGDTDTTRDVNGSVALDLSLDPEGDEVVVALIEGNESRTVYTQTVPE